MKGMGFPLYVNGKRFAEPVTISHVPGPGDAQGILGGMGVDPSMGGLGAYAAYNITKGVLGADAPAPAPLNPEAQPGQPAVPTPGMQADSMGLLWGLISIASAAGLVYHGYRRNHSIGWAIGWAVLGGIAPIIAWPVAFAQGYGKPKSMTPNRQQRLVRNSRWYKIKVIPPAWVGRPGSEKMATFTWSTDPSWAHEFAMKQQNRGAKATIIPTDQPPPFKKNRRRARRARRRRRSR